MSKFILYICINFEVLLVYFLLFLNWILFVAVYFFQLTLNTLCDHFEEALKHSLQKLFYHI